ncbi:MAG TPA: hypothetical protein VJA21_23185 [Verrucomicrobiae bacterium]
MQLTWGRILSLVIAVVYAIVATSVGGLSYWEWSLTLLLPLAFIWFPQEIGSLTGYYKTGYVNVQTPGAFVAFLGWFILVGLPILAFVLTRTHRL